MIINQTSVLTLAECLIVSIVAPIILVWVKHYFAQRVANSNAKNIAAAEREKTKFDYLQLEFEYRTLEKHIEDLSIVLNAVFKRFDQGREINKHDVEAIRCEMAQCPKRKK